MLTLQESGLSLKYFGLSLQERWFSMKCFGLSSQETGLSAKYFTLSSQHSGLSSKYFILSSHHSGLSLQEFSAAGKNTAKGQERAGHDGGRLWYYLSGAGNRELHAILILRCFAPGCLFLAFVILFAGNHKVLAYMIMSNKLALMDTAQLIDHFATAGALLIG